MITYRVYEHLLELVIELDSDSTDLWCMFCQEDYQWYCTYILYYIVE